MSHVGWMNRMQKTLLKKLVGTGLFLILTLDASHPVFGTQINMGSLSLSERKEVSLLRQQGKGDAEILEILKKQKSLSSLGHEEKIKALEQENARLRETMTKMSTDSTGMSLPHNVVLNVTEIARLQDENRKLSAALEGFQENSPTYKNLKEQLVRVQKELELAKIPQKSSSFTPPPLKPPSGLPPVLTPQSPTMASSTISPPPIKQGGPVLGPVIKSPEEIAKENNISLIKTIDGEVEGIQKDIESNPTISSTQNKEHLKLLVEEFFGPLKEYLLQHPEVPGAKKIDTNFKTFVSVSGIKSALGEIEKAQSKEANTVRLPALIEKLNDFIKKTEHFIHTEQKNPFQMTGASLAIRDLLVPRNTVVKSDSSVTSKPKVPSSKAMSTVKDTVSVLMGIPSKVPDVNAALEFATEDQIKLKEDKVISAVLKKKAAAIPELSLLVDNTRSLSLTDIETLWDKIPESVKDSRLEAFHTALALEGVKGLAAEADFNALLQKNGISKSSIGTATKKDDEKTVQFRDGTLKPFVALKLIAEIVVAYRESLGGTEDDQISKLQAKIGAYKTHTSTVDNGTSPVRDTNLQRYATAIKELERQIAELEKKKEAFKIPIETANKIILKFEEIFKSDKFIVPKAFKDFMDSELGQKIQGKLEVKTNTDSNPLGNSSSEVVKPSVPRVSHNDHQLAVAQFKVAHSKFVGMDGKFIPKGVERSKHVFASLLEVPAQKFKALTESQEKSIVTMAMLETPEVIEALIYHISQDKDAFEKSPIIHSLSTQLQAEAQKLTTTPPVTPTEKKAIEAREQLLRNAKGQISNIVIALKK